MLVDDCYHIRFGPEKEKVNAIWCESEVVKRFEEALKKNKEFLASLISVAKEEEELKACTFADSDFTSRFIENTKFRVLWLAMNEVFDGKFDVKKNILEILNSDERSQEILRERVNATLEIMKRERDYELKEKEYRSRFPEN